MQRPIMNIAIAWLIGAYFALMSPPLWQLVLLLIMIIITICQPHVLHMTRELSIVLLFVLCASYAYNTYYDARNVSSISEGAWMSEQATLQGVIVTTVDVDGDQVSFVLKTDEGDRVQVFVRLEEQHEQAVAMQWQRGDRVVIGGALERPDAARNFDTFEYSTYLYYQRIHWLMRATSVADIEVSAPQRWQLVQLFKYTDHIRQLLGNKIEAAFKADYSGFMKSLLIGLRDDLQPEQFRQFSLIGLTHIMAISGLHVGVFIAACMSLLRALGVTREKNMTIMMCLIPFYIVLTGGAPSVVRAGFMALIGLYALRRKRLKDGLSIISFVGLSMLIIHPYYLFQISFQLSFIVTLGLMICVPLINRRLPIRHTVLKNTISVTLAAQLCSFPFTIYYFNHFSLLSWLANFLLVPMISVIVLPSGMIVMLLSLFSEKLASLAATVVDGLNVTIFNLVALLNRWDIFQLVWASPPSWWMMLYYALLWLIVRKRKSPLFYVSGGLLCLILLYGYFPNYWDRNGYVQFIDVGQGDAILIRTPERKIIMIDGGGTFRFQREDEAWKNRRDPYEVGKNLLIPLLKKRAVQHIDYLIVTHGDFDHFGGLMAVLENFRVGMLIINGTVKNNEAYDAFLSLALQQEIPIFIGSEGKQYQIDAHTRLTFLYPLPTHRIATVTHQNAVSLVSLLEMYESRFLFMGDAELMAERELLMRLEGGEAVEPIDVMKVAHHGSKTSTSEQWLSHWQPKLAVISVGRFNTYGHPHPTVLQRLVQHHILTYRTDLHGEVQLEVSAEQLSIRTKLAERWR